MVTKDRSPGVPHLSVRARVSALATVSVALALVVTAFALVLYQREELKARLDEAVLLRAIDIGALIEAGQLPATLTSSSDEESFIQIVNEGGVVVAASENIRGQDPVSSSGLAPGQQRVTQLAEGPIEDDHEFRLAARSVFSPEGVVTVFVGGSLEPVTESTGVLTAALAVGFPVLTLVVAVSSWFLTGRALAPVETIRREVAEISGSSIERRVSVPPSRDEVARLADTMNGMLDRLEEAQVRQRRFVSDASHELRSPLAAIRSTLEVSANYASPAEYRDAIGTSLEDVARLQRLIDDLLADAELEGGVPRPFEPVDLDDIVLEETASMGSASGPSIDTGGVSGAQVSGHKDQLRRAIRNLLENAQRHAESWVTVELREEPDVAKLAVSDDGPGVPADQIEAIFERFARADDARHRQTGGTGLGLAITRAIAISHGGRVYVDSTYDEGARFVLELPLDGGTRG